MIIYNVTLSIDEEVSADWLFWMQETHIPSIMDTGCFMECRLSKILGEHEGGTAYSVMYLARDQAALDGYNIRHAPDMQKAHADRFAGKFSAFRTSLELIKQFDK